MVTFKQVYTALDAQQARLYGYPVGFAKAATIEYNGKYGVFLDMSASFTLAEMLECLCHECGHCATGATHRTGSPWDLVEKHEYKANRWAIEQFLPFNALQDAMHNGCTEPWQLAEAFGLPQPFIEKALHHYTQIRQKTFFKMQNPIDNRQTG